MRLPENFISPGHSFVVLSMDTGRKMRNFKEVLYSRNRPYRFLGSIEALIERVSGTAPSQ